MGAMNWYHEYEIRLSTIWHEVITSETVFSDELYQQFLNTIQEIATYEKYKEKIHFVRYKAEKHFYHVDKYKTYQAERKKGIFGELRLGYFMVDHKFNAQELREWKRNINEVINKNEGKSKSEAELSFSEDEVSTDNSSPQTFTELLSLNVLSPEEDEAYRWTYDVCSYRDSKIILTYTQDDLDEKRLYTYLFSWALAIIDLANFDNFLNYHLKHNFNEDRESFERFLEIVIISHKNTLLRENQIRLLNNWTQSKSFIETIQLKQENNISPPNGKTMEEKPKKAGRKPVDKIEIPKPPKRNKEKWTILDKNDTIKLFDYLISLGCFISDQEKVSKESIAKAMYALTGYSDNNTAELFNFEKLKSKNKKDKEKLIENIKELVISNLK